MYIFSFNETDWSIWPNEGCRLIYQLTLIIKPKNKLSVFLLGENSSIYSFVLKASIWYFPACFTAQFFFVKYSTCRFFPFATWFTAQKFSSHLNLFISTFTFQLIRQLMICLPVLLDRSFMVFSFVCVFMEE